MIWIGFSALLHARKTPFQLTPASNTALRPTINRLERPLSSSYSSTGASCPPAHEGTNTLQQAQTTITVRKIQGAAGR